MSFRALCLNTLCVSALLSGVGPVRFLALSSARAEQNASHRVVTAQSAEKKKQTASPASKPVAGASPVAAAKEEDLVVRAARNNRMYVSSGGDLGALGVKKGLDVPFNIRSYNASLILNQQSQTLWLKQHRRPMR